MSRKISSVLIFRLIRVATSGRFGRDTRTGSGDGDAFNVWAQSMRS
jgi:hypothetical protein